MFQPPAAPANPAPGTPQVQAAPAYGQNAAYPQPYAAQGSSEKYNVLAIISLVTAVLSISLAAIITGHIALSQIGKTGEKGRGLAIAGLIIGYASLVLSVIIGGLLVLAIASDPTILNNM
ncbi:DUF4190 domain-containing protein [Cryobacterium sp. TMT1-21]|uniref:DUF4190 domain-containing protein n=2 Tax=Microbacteriaceae TaxID=85023 RepID=A0AAQ2C4R9_9MICO|nr:DUF4190 domain-containing protein [Cryobacterium shii]TFC87342.1 DUF4190 domain-containing protein [Cryobacterium sp. TmT2-59]TFD10470.1 DUF4190 domain-containing protein [Cryobacterium sp. TMT1-21]TFD18350.1 DUF4190 domain-containing protein [Cryobacterium sp. TMT4-10]TFD27885.1 DUF4190 domain-containing protein [Cryobacterium sp. TMT2-23]TFD39257.1 DUF4190 domain-containing protein [Cryobacterium sp. TMT2-10]